MTSTPGEGFRMKIYDTKGDLILTGTVAEWREDVRKRKMHAMKVLEHEMRQASRARRRGPKPLLKVTSSS